MQDQSLPAVFEMMVRAENRVPIYGPIYEAHDFCTALMSQGFWL